MNKRKSIRRRKAVKPATYHTYRDDDLPGRPVGPPPNAIWLARPSWRALLLNLPEAIKLFCLPLVPALITTLCWYIAQERAGTVVEAIFNALGAVFGFASLAVLVAALPAFGLIQLHSARGELTDFRDDFILGLPMLFRYLVVNLCSLLLFLVGLVLLVVPGLLALHRYSQAHWFVLDREAGIAEALRLSAADSRKRPGPVWSLVFVTLSTRIISLLGIPGLLIGSVLQLAYGYAPAVRYVEFRELDKRK